MNLFKKLFLILLVCLVHNCSATEAVSTDWRIKNGDCQDCIKMPDDEPSNYDFAVYKDKLFISDYRFNKIRVFDKDNHNVKNIELPGTPEIVTIYEEKLYVLIKNNSIGIYDITLDSLTTKRLEVKFTGLEYSGAFFLDSLLVTPLTKDLVAVKSDAKVFNITKPEDSDIIHDFFDFSRLMDVPTDNSFKYRPPKLIDFCGGDGTHLIFEWFESTKTFKSSGFLLLDRNDRSIRRLSPIPDSLGILIHSNAGRGMKIFGNRAYFISELIGEGENAIVVGSYQMN